VNSVLPVGLDTVSTFLRNKRRGNDNAFQAFAFQITIEAVTARTGFVGEYEFVAFRLKAPDHLVYIASSSTDRPQIDHICLAILGDISHRDGFFVNVKADEYCARLCHG
jgi:hypothetical protein